MQLIEASDLGVRAAVYRLKRRDAPLEFLILPMLHIGAPAYYAEVRRRLDACDVVLLEGLRSHYADRLTLAILLLERHRRLRERGLVAQTDALDLRGIRDKLVRADLPGADFDAAWRALPRTARWQTFILLPIVAVGLWFVDPLRLLMPAVELDVLPSRREILYGDAPLDQLIVHARDAALVARLVAYEAEHRAERRLVGIVYGARHMRAVLALLLRRLRYQVVDAEWITVMGGGTGELARDSSAAG